MDRSFLDLLDGPSKKAASTEPPTEQAPIELMTQFLLLISDRRMADALPICVNILEHEPENVMMRKYRRILEQYVSQELEAGRASGGAASASVDESSDEEKEEEEDDEDDDGNDDEDYDDESETSSVDEKDEK